MIIDVLRTAVVPPFASLVAPLIVASALSACGGSAALAAFSSLPGDDIGSPGLRADDEDAFSLGVSAAVQAHLRSITPAEAGFLMRHWGIEQGLPLDRLTSVAWTPDGFLWIGTDDQRLSRFDGNRFLKLNPLNERDLPGWRVSELFCDSQRRLWVRDRQTLTIREGRRFRQPVLPAHRTVPHRAGGKRRRGLANEPRVYLVPAGADILRSPTGGAAETRTYSIFDQAIPLPYDIDGANIDDPDWSPVNSAVVIDPKVCHGKPVISGARQAEEKVTCMIALWNVAGSTDCAL